MTETVDHLLIGAGVAGATAAAWLSDAGSASIMLSGSENTPPYKRPRLSKQYLRGTHTVAEMMVRSHEEWSQSGVQLRVGSPVVELDTRRRRAAFADGSTVSFGTALLATGSLARPLPAPGAYGPRVHTLRTMSDAERIRAQIQPGSRVVVVGGSFNGCEAAASAAARGASVTLVALEEVPLERALGRFVGVQILELMKDRGCVFLGGTSVRQVDVDSLGQGNVITTDERRLPFDVLIACVGAAPDLDLARSAGLELADGGVACDSRMRTSAENVYAAGDIAAYESETLARRIRLERFEAAWGQARTAAANMLGERVVHDDRVPYFHSELDDWFSVSFVGLNLAWDRELLVGDPASGDYSVWYLDGERLSGAAFIGDAGDLQQRASQVLRQELSLTDVLADQGAFSALGGKEETPFGIAASS